ncbi:unnamed protein product [Colias eurytheme]|nr:unnamed protein product [Colias eurytheme]
MSVRQEDGPKNSSSSRGLGLAAAAIGVGVGVGAALYYFFGKRPENPDSAGSTSHWEIEHPDAFDDCVTISEHTTTDTSIISTASDASSNNDMSDSDGASDSNGFDDNESDSDSYYRDEYVSEYSSNTESSYNTSGSYSEVDEIGYLTDSGSDGDADNSDWEEMTSDDLPRRFSYVRPNPRTFLDPRRVHHLLRGDPQEPGGDVTAVYSQLSLGVHHAVASAAADLPQLSDQRQLISLI